MLHVITGGSGSGKSAFAESCIVKMGPGQRIYIATMFPFDEESRRRIVRHQDMRKEKQFTTIECFTGLKDLVIPSGANILLECLSNLTANEMYQEKGAGEATVAAVLQGIGKISADAANLVVVTNEIFSDGMDYEAETKRFQSYLGQLNRALAKQAEQVTEVVYGIPITIKVKEHPI